MEVGFRQNVIMIFFGLVALAVFLTVAALVFMIWEREWTFLDAFYFSFVTMTTVGFGDMVPSELHNAVSCMLCLHPDAQSFNEGTASFCIDTGWHGL